MFVYKADQNMEKMYRAVVKEINKNKAYFGEAAATLIIFKLRLRNKKRYLLVHQETAFFVGILVIVMVSQQYSSSCLNRAR